MTVLGKHEGTDTDDGFSVYTSLAKKTKNSQTWCKAHVMNDAKELVKCNESKGEVYHFHYEEGLCNSG